MGIIDRFLDHRIEVADFIVKFQRATPSDQGFVDSLTRTTMDPYVLATWQDPDDQTAYFSRNAFSNHRDATLILVNEEGHYLGRLTLDEVEGFHGDRAVDLSEIHILPDYQGLGIGQAVIEEVLSLADPLPVQLIALDTNKGARQLYTRLGFKDLGLGSGELQGRHLMTTAPMAVQA